MVTVVAFAAGLLAAAVLAPASSASDAPLPLPLLRPESALTPSCYDVPASDFGRTNNVRATYGSSPHVQLAVGDTAIDFTLPVYGSPEGTPASVNLASLLSKRAAVLVLFGMWTCPAFQGFHADTTFTGSSYVDENALVDAYGDRLAVVHVVGPEPHPVWPFANFDSGTLRMNYWSTLAQPQTYAERVAVSVPPVARLLHPDVYVVADWLDGGGGVGGGRNNPVWCSYAHGARSAVLVGADGKVAFTQPWFNVDEMRTAVAALVGDDAASR
jgi:hypothetical protein